MQKVMQNEGKEKLIRKKENKVVEDGGDCSVIKSVVIWF